MTDRYIPTFLNLVVGPWVLASPFMFMYWGLPALAWTHYVVGGLVTLLAIGHGIWRLGEWASGAMVALGVWLAVSPFVLGYWGEMSFAAGNALVSGLVIVGLAAWHMVASRQVRRHGATFASAEPTEEERRGDR